MILFCVQQNAVPTYMEENKVQMRTNPLVCELLLRSIHLISSLLERGQCHIYLTTKAQNAVLRIYALPSSAGTDSTIICTCASKANNLFLRKGKEEKQTISLGISYSVNQQVHFLLKL